MTTHAVASAVVPGLTEDERWAAWVARGAASDRRARRRLAWVASVVVAALAGGLLLVQMLG